MMRLAVAVADEKAGPAAFVVWRGFSESFKKAAEYGYDGIELALRTRRDIREREVARLCRLYCLGISCISTGQVYADLGLTLSDPDPAGRRRAVEVFVELIELAGAFGCLVNIGRARGFIAQGRTLEETQAAFLESLSSLLPVAERAGVSLVVEPVNRYETNYINNLRECAELLRQVASPNMGMMPDVFHMNIEDAGIGKTLASYGEFIKYIHLADSNRLAPGWGHLDFAEVFSVLQGMGYHGWAAVEILPKPGPDEAAAQAVRALRPLLEQYRANGEGG